MGDFFSRFEVSKFRGLFSLSEKDLKFVYGKGVDKIRNDSFELLDFRIRRCGKNDGRQTPWKGHPVFIAQHATAICCRGCIEKWYGISRRKVLDDFEIKFFVEVVVKWIFREVNRKSFKF